MAEIRRTRTYALPPEELWPLVATSDGLASWLMPNDLEPVEGHRFTMTTDPAPGFDGVVRGEVLEVDPPRLLRFTWVGGPLDTEVAFRLAPIGTGTRLELTHTGFAGLRATLVRQVLSLGWRRLLTRDLPAALAVTATARED